MTQGSLADASGISLATIAHLECGMQRTIMVQTLSDLGDALGVRVSTILRLCERLKAA